MINVLPPELKTSYGYARRNVILRRWVIVFLVALVGLGGLATYGVVNMRQLESGYSAKVNDISAQLVKDDLKGTQTKVEEISSSIKLAVQVLSQEVLFSELITKIGEAMPKGTVLTGLDISGAKGGLDLTASATDYAAATQIQVNLASSSNKIFSKVDINTITCAAANSNSADPGHPCSVSLRALFNTKNQFLFINQKATR